MDVSSTAATPENTTNDTVMNKDTTPETVEQLQLVMDILLISLTVILMLAFGCTIKVADIRSHLSRPISITLATICQFIVIPYAFYGIQHLLKLHIVDALSLTILATCPAGGVSNLYVYWTDGDIALG